MSRIFAMDLRSADGQTRKSKFGVGLALCVLLYLAAVIAFIIAY